MDSIYFDNSSRGAGENGRKTKYHSCYRAEYRENKKDTEKDLLT